MGTIAKGEITLSPVNDAYTVLLTPSSCSISADFDGSNPNLTNAKGTITVKRGTKIVPFKVRQVVYSSAGISVSWSFQEVTMLPFAITQLANTILDGYVKFQITTQDGFNYTTEVQFSFNVVRESTMLDWIQDWEGSKTKVGGTYIMTPKLFVGKKEAVLDTSGTQPTWKEGALTGVYIGPDLLASGENSAGIYGYLKSKEIFHINADGGFIGGWSFNEGGLQSSNGVVNILSEGTVFAQNPQSTTPYWGLYADGHAVFANGNVKFQADGSAEFAGKIISTSGKIGGWNILSNQLYNNRVFLHATDSYIGIDASPVLALDQSGNRIFPDSPEGGIKMWFTSTVDFGFAGWKSGNKVFQLGSVNFIAGWNFDNTSLWFGVKNNSIGEFTTSGITIGSNGIRGIKWRIDSNGDISFMDDRITFSSSSNSGEIVGWKLNESRFSTDKITLVSDDANTGLYMSAAANSQFNSRSAASLENFIDSYGGIYLKVKADSADLAAYDLNGKRIFKIKSNGVSHIAGWNFDNTTLYTGTAATSGYTNTGEITLGPTGLRGYKWRFENDGSGALAGGKINWDADGNLNVDAKISANNITAGIISTASIECTGKWALRQDGSGLFASGRISWTSDGVLTVKNSRLTDVIINGAIRTPFQNGQYSLGNSGPIQISTPGLQNNNNVVIPGAGEGWELAVTIPFTAEYNGFRAIMMNDDWGNEQAGGSWSVNAPDGKYFYENGCAHKTLTLHKNTGVEMIGYGEGNVFKGWIILNRIDKSGDRGFPLYTCFTGIVKDGTLIKIKQYNDEQITCSKIGAGLYRFTFGVPWSSADNYMVFLTGQAYHAGRYASIYEKTTTYFDVYCGDDDSANDGDFQFMVVNISPAYIMTANA